MTQWGPSGKKKYDHFTQNILFGMIVFISQTLYDWMLFSDLFFLENICVKLAMWVPELSAQKYEAEIILHVTYIGYFKNQNDQMWIL